MTVTFQDQPQRWVQALLAELGDTLGAYGGTAGILRDQAPAPLDRWDNVDAVVVSTENSLTQKLRNLRPLEAPRNQQSYAAANAC